MWGTIGQPAYLSPGEMSEPCDLRIRFTVIAYVLLTFASHAQEAPRPAAESRLLHRIDVPTPAELQELFEYAGQALPLVSAHRGGAGVAFRRTASRRLRTRSGRRLPCWRSIRGYTKDGAIVVHHDASLERTTTGRGLVADHTLAELKQLKLKDNAGQRHGASDSDAR